MSDIISPDGLAVALVEHCKKYTDEIVEEVEEGIERIAQEALEEVKSLSPVLERKNGKIKPKKYKKGWRLTIKKTRGVFKATIYNTESSLTWLLENGHLTRLGTGRKFYDEFGKKYAQPTSHIRPANEHAEEKIDKLIGGL